MITYKYKKQIWYIMPIFKLLCDYQSMDDAIKNREKWCRDCIGDRGVHWRLTYFVPPKYIVKRVRRQLKYYPDNYYVMFLNEDDITAYKLAWQ